MHQESSALSCISTKSGDYSLITEEIEIKKSRKLALTSLHTGILFIDHINTTLAADNAAIAVSGLQSFKRICNFHGL